jgi:hypothetical protein
MKHPLVNVDLGDYMADVRAAFGAGIPNPMKTFKGAARDQADSADVHQDHLLMTAVTPAMKMTLTLSALYLFLLSSMGQPVGEWFADHSFRLTVAWSLCILLWRQLRDL